MREVRVCLVACGVRFAAQEAFPAEDGTPLGRPEGNRSFAAALGAIGDRFGLAGSSGRALPLAFASLTALRLVVKILVMEEVLFSRGEYEL